MDGKTKIEQISSGYKPDVVLPKLGFDENTGMLTQQLTLDPEQWEDLSDALDLLVEKAQQQAGHDFDDCTWLHAALVLRASFNKQAGYDFDEIPFVECICHECFDHGDDPDPRDQKFDEMRDAELT